MEDSWKRQAPPVIPTDPEYFAWTVQRQLSSIALSWMILAVVAVLGRVYIRIFMLNTFKIDDYLIVAAAICSVVACSIFLHCVQLGMGKHIFAIPIENFEPLFMWIFIVGVIVPLALCFIKLSVAFLLLPLTQKKWHRRFMWAMVVFLIIFMLFTFLSLLCSCIPIAANWDFTLRPPPMGNGNAKCLPISTFRIIALTNSIINIITDVILAVMPVPLIWTLQVNKRTKASLIFILGLGFFACAAGIIKTPLLFHFFDSTDSTGESSWYYAWQIIEMNVGILAATLPALKPAFRWLLESVRNLATAASHNRSGPSHSLGYKRQVSSGYLKRDAAGSPYDVPMGVSYTDTVICGKAEEVELEELDRYHSAMTRYNSRVEGSIGAQRNGSSDAIWRGGMVDGVPIGPERGQIVRTTEVTVFAS